ncbi:hypothetical protein TrLO_g12288 [Triparma laevis f. longispina]|uniref:SET domain-containing protein n=1 Tax=Triparma laevis f. longispina TaxID=1714387 RepID=A0A9W7FQT5_9STRA|nr:hypothetical protein TrLO_g12288 [Triparma laevis f. longispina]
MSSLASTTTSSSTTASSSKKRRLETHDSPSAPTNELHRWALNNGCQIYSSIEIKPSPLGDSGLFVSSDLPSQTSIITLPSSCIITHSIASESEIGRACIKKNEEVGEKFIMQSYLSLGRREVEGHQFKDYLESLPNISPDPCSWPPSHRALLNGTNLGHAVESLITSTRLDYVNNFPEDFKSRVSLSDFIWAGGIIRSRAFPGRLGREIASDGCGVLLPFIDMANHRRGEPVEWVKNKNSSVSLKLRDGKVAGCEIFNNYGGKGNESFLMSYGFALDDTSDDSYGLELGRRGEGGGVVKVGQRQVLEEAVDTLREMLGGAEEEV